MVLKIISLLIAIFLWVYAVSYTHLLIVNSSIHIVTQKVNRFFTNFYMERE